ncbi:MAG: hypothetical protein ABIQ18_44065 [Umezawaea sp.]
MSGPKDEVGSGIVRGVTSTATIATRSGTGQPVARASSVIVSAGTAGCSSTSPMSCLRNSPCVPLNFAPASRCPRNDSLASSSA